MGGRVALVTGAARGIGAAVARALAGDGHQVALGYSADEAGARRVGEAVALVGSAALPVQVDVRQPDAVDRAVGEIEEAWGPVEVLVNNAGVSRDGLLLRMGDEQWTDVLRTNLDGAFHVTRRVTPGMVRRRFGRIVCVSSVAGSAGSAGQANYAASKSGLVGLSR